MTERCPSRVAGFTLIEGVIVMVLIGALAAVAGVFIVEPFRSAGDMSRRAELVDAAETGLDRMTRELRLAVPNSIRINGNALEFLRSKTGGRYRRLPAPGGGGDPLNRALGNDTFDVLGGLVGSGTVDTRGPGRDCANGAGDCLVINNTGTVGYNAYAGDTVAAIVDAGASTLEFNTGTAGPAFPSHSAHQRFQVLDTVVSYICNGDGTITRHHGYGLNDPQDTTPGGTISLLARDVTACTFTYDGGAGQRHGLVTIDLTLAREGETVRLIDQAHVVNVP